jgi:hypothetical protein
LSYGGRNGTGRTWLTGYYWSDPPELAKPGKN